MAEFQELIKNFDRIRDYMRQFFVYGYKSRSSYEGKSARTYDNERRRIESWLSGCIQSGYTQKEKHVYISVDSKTIPQNPLYAAWKSKSFTDKDLLLHFLLPDLLRNQPEGMTAGELCDAISAEYGAVFDSQTVRLKLKEYEQLGLFESRKQGKRLCYRLLPGPCLSAPFQQQTWQSLLEAVTYFQEAAPFGFIGSTILDHENTENRWFSFKHHFLVHTLEDGVLADCIAAMKEHRRISFENKSSRSGNISTISGIPLKILVSTQTGRRYLCLYLNERRRFINIRLDSMTNVTPLEICSDYERKQELLHKNMPRCWGVSFGGSSRMEEIYIKILLDEENESHILNRLYREGRGGEILKIREHEYLYSGAFFDTNEMLSWVKTFTGRILDIQGTNAFAITKITRDFEKMYEMYRSPDARPSQKAWKPEAYGHDEHASCQPPHAIRASFAEIKACSAKASADPEKTSAGSEKANAGFTDANAGFTKTSAGSEKTSAGSADANAGFTDTRSIWAAAIPQMAESSSRMETAGPSSQELFDKIYGCYYQTVRRILSEASEAPITQSRMNELSMKYGYSESGLAIVPKLTGGAWPLLKAAGPSQPSAQQATPNKQRQATPAPRGKLLYRSALQNPELLLPGYLPLTKLQKSWLKSLLFDRRIRLFLTDQQLQELAIWLSGTEALYQQEDFYYFDQYLDGDDYAAPPYREHFQTILKALREKRALILVYENRRGQRSAIEAAPYQLQYSSKDDKFRLCCLKYSRHDFNQNTVLNLSRIKACHLSRQAAPEHIGSHAFRPIRRASQPVTIEISGERNSLERCMLHFANYEKHTSYREESRTWLCSIYYDLADETELLIDILSFGPVIRVLGPDSFRAQLWSRVQKQHKLFYRAV